jgi:hypothetical protein
VTKETEEKRVVGWGWWLSWKRRNRILSRGNAAVGNFAIPLIVELVATLCVGVTSAPSLNHIGRLGLETCVPNLAEIARQNDLRRDKQPTPFIFFLNQAHSIVFHTPLEKPRTALRHKCAPPKDVTLSGLSVTFELGALFAMQASHPLTTGPDRARVLEKEYGIVSTFLPLPTNLSIRGTG